MCTARTYIHAQTDKDTREEMLKKAGQNVHILYWTVKCFGLVQFGKVL